MLNCYHIPIYHNRAVPCRVARLLQPCWLGSVRHGFDRVYTSNFNRTVPCRAVAYRAGTEKLSRVNGVLVHPTNNLTKTLIYRAVNGQLNANAQTFGLSTNDPVVQSVIFGTCSSKLITYSNLDLIDNYYCRL